MSGHAPEDMTGITPMGALTAFGWKSISWSTGKNATCRTVGRLCADWLLTLLPFRLEDVSKRHHVETLPLRELLFVFHFWDDGNSGSQENITEFESLQKYMCCCLSCFVSWGRWRDILSHGRFKRRMTERDVETICRAILVYCLLHYRGDENIKSFIWDLISPAENGKTKELQNHSGNYQLLPFRLSAGYLVPFSCKGFSQSKSLMSPLSQVCLSLCHVGVRGKK